MIHTKDHNIIDFGDSDHMDVHCVECETKNMNTYLLYIKSHCELPDYETEVEAKNRQDAIELLCKGNPDFSRQTIEENVVRRYKNGKIK